jgi:phosphoglycerate kinase
VRTLRDLSLTNSTIALRCDFNVPLSAESEITDDLRIAASLPTINALRDAGARVVILAHLGRPEGTPVAEFSLAPVARRLSEMLDLPVHFSPDADADLSMIEGLEPGEVALLENVRFDARETSKDPGQRRELASSWAVWADGFVSDGFGVVHRTDWSDSLNRDVSKRLLKLLLSIHILNLLLFKIFIVLLRLIKIVSKI